jgi:peptidyl-prolyl cis-trans isomerase SurA
MKCWKAGTIALLLFLKAASSVAVPQVLDSAAVIVNKGVILESEINQLLRMVQLHARQRQQPLPEVATLRHQVREQLIMESIQLQLAAQMGLQVLDKEIEQAIAEVTQRTQLSPDRLRQQLAQEGLDWPSYREQLCKTLLVNKVRQQQIRHRINILPQEVDGLAKQLAQKTQEGVEVSLSHILLPLSEDPSVQQVEQTKQLAQRLMTQLRQGADFAQLAITHSADPQALNGGLLGWARLEALPTLFADKLQGVKKGTAVGPIRTGVGFYILRVDDRRDPEQQTTLEIHARHILLKPSVIKPDQQIKAELQQLAHQIKKREHSFDELARRYSQDPGSAAKGGDLGWADPALYDPAFAAVLRQLATHQLSQPVRTAVGWHLIERLGTRQGRITEADRKEQAMQMLWERKLAEESQNWLQEQRAAAYIKVINP